MKTITKKQEQILMFLSDYIDENGYPPSYLEICIKVGLKSKATVAGHIDRLIRKEFIKKTPNRSRSLVIIDKVWKEQYESSRINRQIN